MHRLHTAIPAAEAAGQAPQLRQLIALSTQSNRRLQLIRGLLPPALRQSVRAGPVRESEWCLLVSNAAVAAKLRQLSPMLLAHLRTKGEAVQTLRIKIATAEH